MAMPMADEEGAPSLTRLERAAGAALGAHPMAPLPPAPTTTARAALERVIAGFLERTPCVVSFSGGRDSSAVLAVAAHVARRDGLPLPVPFTFRFPGKPLTEESDWQEHVIAHLGLDDWQRVELHEELDLLGDVARRCLTEIGLMWPANAYLHVPVFRAARGGTVLTGLDGDGLFGDWRWGHAQAVLHRRVAPHPRDVVRVARAAGGASSCPAGCRPTPAPSTRAPCCIGPPASPGAGTGAWRGTPGRGRCIWPSATSS
jgi:asparagine synthase (glutamine-hydrolysing)